MCPRIIRSRFDKLCWIRWRNNAPSGRNDILATAIEKLEHADHVRGVWKCVGIRDYFGRSHHMSPGVVSQEELDIIVTQVKQETQGRLGDDEGTHESIDDDD